MVAPWGPFLLDVLTNVVANVIFWVFGGLFIGGLVVRRRRQQHRFFGTVRNKRITVYLSGVSLLGTEVKDLSGEQVPYLRSVLLEDEFTIIPELSAIFTSRSILAPETFAGLIDGLFLSGAPRVQFSVSPPKFDAVKGETVICVGSAKFNSATRYYQENFLPYLSVVKNKQVCHVLINYGSRKGEIKERESGKDIGVLVKIYDKERKSTVFIAAGLGLNGTRAAVYYLAERWHQLFRDYRDESFGICLGCDHIHTDEDGYKSAVELFALPFRSGEAAQG